ncbi:glycoside hydrolase family 70 protein [Leuconostoc litchii]|uniref:glycoside hydrolase family 70 protein n=1 Tax=Leuconostoc litchii TaxID=1981069 RepID=UPI003D67FE4D
MLVIAGSLSIIGTTSFLQQAHADVTSGDQAVIVAAATADKNTTDTTAATADKNTTDTTAATADKNTTDTTAATADKNTTDTTAATADKNTTDTTAATADKNTTDTTAATADKNTTDTTAATADKNTTDTIAATADKNTTDTTAATADKNTTDTTAATADKNTTDTTAATVDKNTSATNSTDQSDVVSVAQKSQTIDNKENQSTTATLATIQASSNNVKIIDGKTYYIDDDGQIKKNFATVIDGKVLYFDKDTGAMADTNDYQFLEGLTSENNSYTEHNASVGTSSDNYTNIDGYLTADSWYRPKDILVNGESWKASSDNDLRPLLMTWWPDKATQVNYLNAMKYLDTDDTDTVYTTDNSQESLNSAAQDIQVKIEQKISQEGQTQWLKDDISQFVDSQPNWNIASESKGTDHLQGGALLYVNNDKTPNANSDYRLLNRTPTNQTGKPSYTIDPTQGGYDFLLANDVDNSNPVVQAEQLNWMYYLLNFGSITNNDADANFDSIRVDAVDNVDADLLQIAADYFKAAYGVDKSDAISNQHVSILEDWSDNDAVYVSDHGDNQLSMDNKLRLSLKYSLTMPPVDQYGNKRSGLEPFLTNSLVNRSNDATENTAQPNYSFVRAHDSEVQTVIAEIIKQRIDPDADGLSPTMEQLTEAFKIYNADQLKTTKEFTQYNIPSTYATILTNKDTVPRVYYGDMYTDDGQYMSTKSLYYDAIDTLLKSRIKYVSGGQTMSMSYMQGDSDMPADSYRGVLTSVRYGKGAMTATDKGTKETRKQGIAVIESNNPDLKLSDTDQVVVDMGIAHKNQAYRPALLTTKDGIATYVSDSDVPKSLIRHTNSKGQLIFNKSDIVGTANPQVSGYLAVWVPFGAKDTQDARTESSTETTTDGKTLHSNAALDSQVIYESFSNFQYTPTTEDEYANVKIANNTDLYKSWGITNFEFPPQYRSSTDNSFLDSIIQNGYAFTDRYDLGFNTPTKYGTVDQLRTAIKALHATNISAMADWVPDQIYNLTGKEVVAVQRVNNSGIYNQDSVINNTLYASQTVGGGDYQSLYGGAFLDEIKKLYPSLFEVNQISTGVPMNPSEKIKEWSAKYFNGTNIQGRGAYYVLKDWATNEYFKVSTVSDSGVFLPKQLTNEESNTGFISTADGMTYYSTSGYQAKDTFIQDDKSNWYYFDQNGHMTYGFQQINGNSYYFLPNGIELQDALLEDSKGNTYYFNQTGKQSIDGYYMLSNKTWRYFDKNGVMANSGLTTVTLDDQQHIQYFDKNGIQVKGVSVKCSDGKLRYFDTDSGDMVTNRFGKNEDGTWAYFGSDGVAITGTRVINGQSLFFAEDGRQAKGTEAVDENGQVHYYDADSGALQKNRFANLSNNTWAFFDQNGNIVTGAQVINGQKLFFENNGNQVKGREYTDTDGKMRYYDADSGEMITNRFERLSDNDWAYFDTDGVAVTGEQIINGQHLYFKSNGHQVKGESIVQKDGSKKYYDVNSGELITV